MKVINKILILLMILCLTGCSSSGDTVQPSANAPNASRNDASAAVTENTGQGVSTELPGDSSSDFVEQTEPVDVPPETTLAYTDATEPSDTPQESTVAPTYETVPPAEDGTVEIEKGKLSFTSCGRYAGAFVEDGSDRSVENVAAILVTNLSGEYLTYASLKFEIDGVAATFVLTGLPAGTSAWVLEQNALEIGANAQFVALDSVMQFIPQEANDELEVTMSDGLLSAKNLTDSVYVDGYIYYKQLHTDGNFLGGITYRTGIGDLAAGATIEVTAGHARAENCSVVRITQDAD